MRGFLGACRELLERWAGVAGSGDRGRTVAVASVGCGVPFQEKRSTYTIQCQL